MAASSIVRASHAPCKAMLYFPRPTGLPPSIYSFLPAFARQQGELGSSPSRARFYGVGLTGVIRSERGTLQPGLEKECLGSAPLTRLRLPKHSTTPICSRSCSPEDGRCHLIRRGQQGLKKITGPLRGLVCEAGWFHSERLFGQSDDSVELSRGFVSCSLSDLIHPERQTVKRHWPIINEGAGSVVASHCHCRTSKCWQIDLV
jgi:hypothetical protein